MGLVAPTASGARSQCADIIKIDFGRGIDAAHRASSPIHAASSRSGGAPCATKMLGRVVMRPAYQSAPGGGGFGQPPVPGLGDAGTDKSRPHEKSNMSRSASLFASRDVSAGKSKIVSMKRVIAV